MKIAVVVNALLPGDRWTKTLHGVQPVLLLVGKLERIADRRDIFLLSDRDAEQALRSEEGLHGALPAGRIRPPGRKTAEVLRAAYASLDGYDEALFVCADAPLLDVEVTRHMLQRHHEEYAEYTYGEGFPAGFTPEIVKRDLLPKLAVLAEKKDGTMERSSIFDTLSTDINSFDVEPLFSSEDFKMRRIECSTSLKRNALIVENVFREAGAECDFECFRRLVHESPRILRTVPAYVEVEITNRPRGAGEYSPCAFLKRDRGDMALGVFDAVLEKLRGFSETFHLEISYLGEALLHGEIKPLLEHAVADPCVHVILRTDGVLCTPEFSSYLSDLRAPNLSVILEIDAAEHATYRNIRGGDLNRVERNARYLLSRMKKSVYVQMVRVDDNEEELLKFFDVWEKEGARVIIQKYNSYLGLLPDRSKHDLRPLRRNCCWHLQRDLVVFHNADVPRCKQDIEGIFPMGNILREDMSAIWERGLPHYAAHCENKYDRYCSMCDEYYTYNF
jgi:spiro-SPASM protein